MKTGFKPIRKPLGAYIILHIEGGQNTEISNFRFSIGIGANRGNGVRFASRDRLELALSGDKLSIARGPGQSAGVIYAMAPLLDAALIQAVFRTIHTGQLQDHDARELVELIDGLSDQKMAQAE